VAPQPGAGGQSAPRGDPRTSFDGEQDRCHVLDCFALFHGLPTSLLDYVCRHASEQKLREGQTLFFKNDPSDFLALVLEGQIHEILYGPEGQELIVATPRAGEAIDEAALLDRHNRSFTSIACMPSRVLKLPRRHFPMLTSMPVVLERANSALCMRLRQAMDNLENICLHRLESRLARYLLIRISAQDQGHGTSAEIVLPATQSILAAMLNVSRSKLNAQLQAWQRSNLITHKGSRLHVHDIDQLRCKAYMSADAGVTARGKVANPLNAATEPARAAPNASIVDCPIVT
jgi:CRP-like cAMP-binding protein